MFLPALYPVVSLYSASCKWSLAEKGLRTTDIKWLCYLYQIIVNSIPLDLLTVSSIKLSI